MSKHNRFKIPSSTAISLISQIRFVRNIIGVWKHGVKLGLTAWVVAGRAVAQTSDATRCTRASTSAVNDLIVFLNELHGIALEIAFPAAVVFYAWAGLLWMSGGVENQQKARARFVNTTIGLIIVILSEGPVSIISNIFCGGGV